MVAMTDRDVHRLEQEVLRLQRQLQEVQERTANHVALLQQQLANKAQHIEVETFHNEQRLLKTEHLSHLFVRDFRPRSSPSRTTRRSRPSSGRTQTRPLLRESAGIWVSLLFIFQDSSSAGAHYRWSLGERNTFTFLSVTLEHETSHEGRNWDLCIIWKLNILYFHWCMVYDRTIFERVQRNLNIEKIIFKVVQMKFLAMHITNQKLSFDILYNIFMQHDLFNILMIFSIKEKLIILSHTVCCWLFLQIFLCYYDCFCAPGTHMAEILIVCGSVTTGAGWLCDTRVLFSLRCFLLRLVSGASLWITVRVSFTSQMLLFAKLKNLLEVSLRFEVIINNLITDSRFSDISKWSPDMQVNAYNIYIKN